MTVALVLAAQPDAGLRGQLTALGVRRIDAAAQAGPPAPGQPSSGPLSDSRRDSRLCLSTALLNVADGSPAASEEHTCTVPGLDWARPGRDGSGSAPPIG